MNGRRVTQRIALNVLLQLGGEVSDMNSKANNTVVEAIPLVSTCTHVRAHCWTMDPPFYF
jgi:hypothetical protein